jgi:hypothetical protein
MSKHLQHKLFNYDAQPPREVWEKISVVLDSEAEKPFPERLINYESEPPPFIWDNIAAALNAAETPVIPLRKRFSKPFRYGSAAASVLLAALLINLLLSKKSVSKEGDVASEIKHSASAPHAAQKTSQSPGGFNGNEEKETAATFIYANRGKNIPSRIVHIHSNNKRVNTRINKVTTTTNSAIQFEFLDRYTVFSKNTDEAFRVSKKLFNLFLCSEVNEYCRLNIEMVKGKVASPSVLASADFSGVLDLLQSINNQ